MQRYNHKTCRSYLGKMVRVHTQQGIQEGVVERVTKKGLYMRRANGGNHLASGPVDQRIFPAEQLDNTLDAELVYGRPYGYGAPYGRYRYGYGYGYGYNPAAFFVPFLSILALSSLLFW
ncbi:hypothetical protein OS242_00685 [Tumebacillus sp. DT12]|uniref:Uncharacterized protein n=1 Tax=Tumebacillus lacus TaxID=2995335 RepID=A0ABT3WW90_9BACL|nr:hypothetical protein [Tumebacillus lacus]MCX7568481.1 hypothetical protein [Tumebacillus lacus]